LIALMPSVAVIQARASDPICISNLRLPRIAPSQCGETIIDYNDTHGLMSISAMTFGPDGSLYIARPATREIVRFTPDENGFIAAPYPSPKVFAADLPEPPVGLTYADDIWYVSGDTMIWRLQDLDLDGVADTPEIIVRDLPGGVGGWLGNLHVGPDGRLYVTKAASCDSCEEADERRAALLSFALDGSDMRIVAGGLRNAYDFGWINGTLYIVDDERDDYAGELNAIPTSANTQPVDFGWPRCGTLASASVGNCDGVTQPIVNFPAGSHPAGMVVYQGSPSKVMPLKDSILVALHGNTTFRGISGFFIVQVLVSEGSPSVEPILPKFASLGPMTNLSDASLFLTTFYPTHPIGIAADSRGWLYISTIEGTITRLRPRPNG
jgi:glucose/arabinose dehydrogenase